MSKRKIRDRYRINEDTEMRMLIFLWRWKVCTTKVLRFRFYPNLKRNSAYRRLIHFEKDGYIRAVKIGIDSKYCWMLQRKGYQLIKDRLGVLAEDGYLSESPMHDLYVAAFHYGSWLANRPNGISIISEQQLRRQDPETYPAWVPSCRLHRPDGFTRIDNGQSKKLLAIEVELSAKRKRDYRLINSHYESEDQIDRVLWLVRNKSIENSVRLLNQNGKIASKKYNLIRQSDFTVSGWDAPFCVGPEEGMTMAEFMKDKCGINAGKSRDNCYSLNFFDFRKSA